MGNQEKVGKFKEFDEDNEEGILNKAPALMVIPNTLTPTPEP